MSNKSSDFDTSFPSLERESFCPHSARYPISLYHSFRSNQHSLGLTQLTLKTSQSTSVIPRSHGTRGFCQSRVNKSPTWRLDACDWPACFSVMFFDPRPEASRRHTRPLKKTTHPTSSTDIGKKICVGDTVFQKV